MSRHDGQEGVHSTKREPALDLQCSWTAMAEGYGAGVHHTLQAQCRELFEAAERIAERARSLPLVALETRGEERRSMTTDHIVQPAGLVAHDPLARRIAVYEKAAWPLRSRLN